MNAQSTIPEEYKLIYSNDFERPQDLANFEMTDPDAWRIGALSSSTLELHQQSEYILPVRSPFNIALISQLELGSFILEVDVAQSGRDYGHRDLCFFFGFKDPSNFYYVHIASKADDHANNIFIVNDEPRTKIASNTTSGSDWGSRNSWHKVRIERKIEKGLILVYFDNMDQPAMTANDIHFLNGKIGFGSFDDTGHFDNVKVWAPQQLVGQSGIFLSTNQKN